MELRNTIILSFELEYRELKKNDLNLNKKLL